MSSETKYPTESQIIPPIKARMGLTNNIHYTIIIFHPFLRSLNF